MTEADFKHTQAAWHRREAAGAYHEYTKNYNIYHETSNDLVEIADIWPDHHVLDLACGTGITAMTALRRLGARGHVTAVDFSEEMLAIARDRYQGSRISWRRCTAEDAHTVCDHMVDRVICNMAIWQFDLRAALSAITSAMAPDGRLIFSFGYRLPAGAKEGRIGPAWADSLEAEGFDIKEVCRREYRESAESLRSWLKIPMWSNLAFQRTVSAESTVKLLKSGRPFLFLADFYVCGLRGR